MTLHVPIALQPGTGDPSIVTTAQEFRNYSVALLGQTFGFYPVQGVPTAADYAVSQNHLGADLSVDVAAGYAWVIGDDITSQGTYLGWNDGVVNVPGFTKPASGTFNHRLVLQIQDKLSNGTWTGYQQVLTPLLDTGSGTPAEPNSALTLAVIQVTSAQSNIQNAQISDYRKRTGPVVVNKTSSTSRTTSTTPTDDPDLQLLNLAANVEYTFDAQLFYNGVNSPSTGGIGYTFRMSSGCSLNYQRKAFNANNPIQDADATLWQGTQTASSGTFGSSYPASTAAARLFGRLSTGNAPAYCVLQWAPLNNTGTAAVMQPQSYMRAMRLS